MSQGPCQEEDGGGEEEEGEVEEDEDEEEGWHALAHLFISDRRAETKGERSRPLLPSARNTLAIKAKIFSIQPQLRVVCSFVAS